MTDRLLPRADKVNSAGNEKRLPGDIRFYTKPLEVVTNGEAYLSVTAGHRTTVCNKAVCVTNVAAIVSIMTKYSLPNKAVRFHMELQHTDPDSKS